MEIVADPVRAPGEHWTYADYLSWPEDERRELIDGQAWSMSPSPNWAHQSLVGKLYLGIILFLRGKPCQVALSPFDTLLPKGDEEDGQGWQAFLDQTEMPCDDS